MVNLHSAGRTGMAHWSIPAHTHPALTSRFRLDGSVVMTGRVDGIDINVITCELNFRAAMQRESQKCRWRRDSNVRQFLDSLQHFRGYCFTKGLHGVRTRDMTKHKA
jgi:hypothetical protein